MCIRDRYGIVPSVKVELTRILCAIAKQEAEHSILWRVGKTKELFQQFKFVKFLENQEYLLQFSVLHCEPKKHTKMFFDIQSTKLTDCDNIWHILS